MATTVERSRVLVVDDEPQITRVLRTVLTSQGYQVRTAGEGESALSDFTEWRPELVITDLFMPHMDGVELCRRIRAMSTVPIIVLSVKGEERTKVEALDSGADDYVTKPFGIDELLARVRAALRRGARRDRDRRRSSVGDFRIDLEGRRVHVGGSEIRLTPKEFDLFVYMARHPEPRHHAPHAARSGLGRGVAGAARVPARLHGAAAEEARARSLEPALPRDRAVGRLSVQSERIIRRFAGWLLWLARRSCPPALPPVAAVGADPLEPIHSCGRFQNHHRRAAETELHHR